MRKFMYVLIVVMVITLFFIISRFEVDFGRCVDNEGNGKLYNGKVYYNYISYHNIAHENDIVMTLSLNDRYNECIERWDYIIFKNI